jgi:hypothetical protein
VWSLDHLSTISAQQTHTHTNYMCGAWITSAQSAHNRHTHTLTTCVEPGSPQHNQRTTDTHTLTTCVEPGSPRYIVYEWGGVETVQDQVHCWALTSNVMPVKCGGKCECVSEGKVVWKRLCTFYLSARARTGEKNTESNKRKVRGGERKWKQTQNESSSNSTFISSKRTGRLH